MLRRFWVPTPLVVAAILALLAGHAVPAASASTTIYLPRVDNTLIRQAAPVEFSRSRDLVYAPFELELSTATPGATILYTLDGSAPRPGHGHEYAEPLLIGTTTVVRARAIYPGVPDSPIATHTYLVPPHVVAQPRWPNGVPKTWGRFEGEPVEADYGMDPQVTQDSRYAPEITKSLERIPSVSIVMAPDDLFEPQGIYANPISRGREWERPASLEMLSPGGSAAEENAESASFQIDAGVRIAGEFSRLPSANWRHSLSLQFRSEYGAKKLERRLFPESPASAFDAIRVRAGQADAFEYFPAKAQYLHDEWGRRTQAAMGSPAARGDFVHLYLNGLYWGLYNLTEEIDAEFAAQQLGGDKDDYDLIEQTFLDGPRVDAGSRDAFDELTGLDPATPEGYAAMRELLDLEQYADYTLLQIYAGNRDWPHNNWWAMRRRAAGARFVFLVWDIERSTMLWTEHPAEDLSGTTGAAGLHGKLVANPEYRMLFADRAHRHLFGTGALSPGVAGERYRQLARQIESAIVAESARWGDIVPGRASYYQNRPAWDRYRAKWGDGYPQNRDDHWAPERDRLLGQFFPHRRDHVVAQLRRHGLFPTTEAPTIRRSGRAVRLQAPHGDILYTLNGDDPRLPEGAVSPSARVYKLPIPIEGYARIKARARDGGVWSPLSEMTVGRPRLVFSEVHYHPAGSPDAEFVELFNPLESSVDLGSAVFTDGIEYRFPVGAELAPGEHLVLVSDADSFTGSRRGRSTHLPSIEYAGRLSNGGETLRLESRTGQVLAELTYDDNGTWPVAPDGFGWSLVPRNPVSPGASGEAWRASARPGGSPGQADPDPGRPQVVINEILAHSESPFEDAVELRNLGDARVDLGGWYLSDDGGDVEDLLKFRIPDGTVIEAQGHRVFYAGDFDGQATDAPFGLSSAGEEVFLTAKQAGTLTGYIHGFEFPATATNRSFGRVTTSAGADYAPLDRPTFGVVEPVDVAAFRTGRGATNSAAWVAPVVVNEIVSLAGGAAAAGPSATARHWIELHNRSDRPVELGPSPDSRRQSVRWPGWRLRGALEFDFEVPVSVPAGGYLVLSTDPTFPAGTAEQLPGAPHMGPVTVTGDHGLRLEYPIENPGATTTYGWADRMTIPVAGLRLAEARRSSLQRVDPDRYGNDPRNWQRLGGPGTLGRPNASVRRIYLPWAET